MTTCFIDGENVILRPLERSDYEVHYQRWLNDRRVTRYLYRGTFPMTGEQVARAYDDLLKSDADIELCVVTKDAESRPVGIAGLHAINWIARSAEFRVLLGEPELWGRGLGTEIAQLMIAYGFELLNLNKVWLGVSLGNEGADRSYVKSGFKEEGTLRQEVYRNNQYYDVKRMSILRAEYLECVEQWPTFARIQDQFRE